MKYLHADIVTIKYLIFNIFNIKALSKKEKRWQLLTNQEYAVCIINGFNSLKYLNMCNITTNFDKFTNQLIINTSETQLEMRLRSC